MVQARRRQQQQRRAPPSSQSLGALPSLSSTPSPHPKNLAAIPRAPSLPVLPTAKAAAAGGNKPVHSNGKVKSYSRLCSQIDVFRHSERRVPTTDRLDAPLPLDVPALGSLLWARVPLESGDADPPLEVPIGARVGGSLSTLGLGGRTLVAFGGRSAAHADAPLAPAEPLACDVVQRQWSSLEAALTHTAAFGACARWEHASAVLGHAQSLLALCGGEAAGGRLLDDICLLEMRSIEGAEAAERRRELRARRSELFDELLELRARQSQMRASLDAATTLAQQWQQLLDGGSDQEGAEAAAGLQPTDRHALVALRSEVAQLQGLMGEVRPPPPHPQSSPPVARAAVLCRPSRPASRCLSRPVSRHCCHTVAFTLLPSRRPYAQSALVSCTGVWCVRARMCAWTSACALCVGVRVWASVVTAGRACGLTDAIAARAQRSDQLQLALAPGPRSQRQPHGPHVAQRSD